MVRSKEYSNETARMIDEEIKRYVQEGYDLAEDIILKNKDKVELIAKNLLENETLSGEEVTFIIENGRMPDPPKLEDQLDSADEEKTEDNQEEAPEKE